ncbi:DUF4391 domain-containing protein [Massiliimalia timonensis]|uniref:DUF4391 domain-containing protein n=1 Tax=Massiliimalia timonensis TaxID=1987501 RepID=UPI000B8AD5E2|nr:DUF4391 domain-containing protein [Massiliimalia timonensis]
MLGLPKNTELNKQLPKNAIYAKFQMNTTAKERIDRDISRIYIVNEVSASKINLNEGAEVKSFFVMSVILKRKDYDEKNIITLSKLIPQNMVMVLEYENQARLAVFHTKLMQTEWFEKEKLSLELKGLNFDTVWENIIVQIGGLTVEQGNSLDEQIVIDEQRNKLQKEIARLEKLARAEKQPKKKFELVQKIQKLKEEIG